MPFYEDGIFVLIAQLNVEVNFLEWINPLLLIIRVCVEKHTRACSRMQILSSRQKKKNKQSFHQSLLVPSALNDFDNVFFLLLLWGPSTILISVISIYTFLTMNIRKLCTVVSAHMADTTSAALPTSTLFKQHF